MGPSHFVDAPPEEILPPDIPTAGKVVDFLVFRHVLNFFQFGTLDIKVDIPFVCILTFAKAVELKSIDDTLIFRTMNFVVKVGLWNRINSFVFALLDIATLWILKKDGWGSAFEFTFA